MPKSPSAPAPRWTLWQVIQQTFTEFFEDNCMRMGAALAYYTIFSIAPLLVIAVGVLGWVMGGKYHSADDSPIVHQVTGLIGGGGGEAIKTMVNGMMQQHKGGVVATIVGFAVLLFGATGVFGELQASLNTIWEVMPKPGRTVWQFLRQRFLSFTMVAGVCFLLLVSLIVSTALSAVEHFVGGGGALHYLWYALNFIVSLVVISTLFALMFKVLPDVEMDWKDTLVGAVATAVLFTVGKWAIGLYLGKASVGSAYGAVGSLVVLLLWIYYSSLIFLIGAEFTRLYACHRGSQYVPAEHAISLSEVRRIHEGIPHNELIDLAAARAISPAPARHPAPVSRETDRQPTAPAPGRALPTAVGFALGYAAAQFRRGPKPKKLVLAPGVFVADRPRKAHPDPLLERFRQGWRRGTTKN